jgi:hypothetical protein
LRVKGGYALREAQRLLTGFHATQRCFEHYAALLRQEIAELEPKEP